MLLGTVRRRARAEATLRNRRCYGASFPSHAEPPARQMRTKYSCLTPLGSLKVDAMGDVLGDSVREGDVSISRALLIDKNEAKTARRALRRSRRILRICGK